MSSIDQQFIEFIVKSLVGHPDEVKVERTIDEKGVLLKLTVNQEDLGRVIGKRGSTAQSIRTLLRALGTKNDARYNLKIVDPEGDNRPRPSQDAPADSSVADDSAVADNVSASDSSDAPASDMPADDTPTEVPAEEPALAETSGDSLADKTRKELAELDDLDI